MILFVSGTMAVRAVASVTDCAISAGDTICAPAPAVSAVTASVTRIAGWEYGRTIIVVFNKNIRPQPLLGFVQVMSSDIKAEINTDIAQV